MNRRRHRTKSQTERHTQARTRAMHALAIMRREKLSLAEACRLEHIKPVTFKRYAGSAIRQDKPGGRYRATAGDSFRRELQVPTALGPARVSVRGSKAARELSKYANAVNRYLRKGDTSQLKLFAGKKVRAGKQRVELITDPRTLSALAEADALKLDQLYASVTGAS